jgi:radical SAM protein with 4Fe4S-binding SPASM domain
MDKSCKNELSTGRLMTLIDEITEAGCLFMLISGGEPLIRKDFRQIYRHMKSNGLLVTLFTNGTLVNEGVIELFEELPPQAVEISLYGATPKTYELITGVKGSYRRCLRGVENLLKHKIHIKLKTVLMTLNRHELSGMEKIAKDLGVKFRFDAALFPRFNGDTTPLTLRVPPDEAVEMELSDAERFRNFREYFRKNRKSHVSDSLYVCSAGITNFHIDPYGNLQPCLMTSDIRYDLSSGNFLTGWNDVMPGIMEKKVPEGYTCNACEKQVLCGFCPAVFKMENGSEYVRSEYLCSMGRHRYHMILYN